MSCVLQRSVWPWPNSINSNTFRTQAPRFPRTVGWAREAGHDDAHYVEGQSVQHPEEDGQPADIRWIRWNDQSRREIAMLPPRPVTQARPNQADRDLCLLSRDIRGAVVSLGPPSRSPCRIRRLLPPSCRTGRAGSRRRPGRCDTALAAAISRLADLARIRQTGACSGGSGRTTRSAIVEARPALDPVRVHRMPIVPRRDNWSPSCGFRAPVTAPFEHAFESCYARPSCIRRALVRVTAKAEDP